MSKNNVRALALFLLVFASRGVWAGAPDWLKAITQEPVPAYPADTKAVILFDEQYTTVNDKGEMKTVYRRAYKILNTAGRDRDTVSVYFDSQTEITHMNAWAIPPVGNAFESKDKDAIESGLSDVSLYSDSKIKILSIPYTEPGTVVGYEYEQVRRSDVLQEIWDFQENIPVREARFTLSLPTGWETREHWTNWPAVKAVNDGNRQTWVLRDLPAIKPEASMPAWRAVAGRMAVGIVPTKAELKQQQRLSWNEYGTWYWQLAAPKLQSTPSIQNKVKELTSDKKDVWSKMRALAAYAQRNIRYVAIEIGAGGYQPHPASETFSNSYGDCKDKAVLLSAMLHEIGVDSYLLLTHTARGVVAPDFPTMYSFNHEILAIRVPVGMATDRSLAVYQHPKLGALLIFDPTSSRTPLGMLPAYLQGGRGLLVSADGGEVIDFPSQPADTNLLQRTATLTLTEAGGISGQVKEVRTGSSANEKRAELLAVAAPDRKRVLESFLSSFLQGFTLKDYSIENLDNYDQELVVQYKFEAPVYAKQMGGLWLIRPRVLGAKANMEFESEDRKYPLELEAASLQTDIFDISLPLGFSVDELPAQLDLHNDYARYTSHSEQKANALHYERTYEIDKVVVPVDAVKSMRQFYRAVALDERASAVLKKQ